MRLPDIDECNGITAVYPLCKLFRLYAFYRLLIFVFPEAAEVFIIKVLDLIYARVLPAYRALFPPFNFKDPASQIQAVKDEKLSGQYLSDPCDQLQRLVCLNASDDPGKGANGPALRAGWNKARCRRFRKSAAITGSVFKVEDRYLSLKLIYRAKHKRDALYRAGIAYEIPCPVIVRAVDRDIMAFKKAFDISGIYLCIYGLHFSLFV